MRITVIATGIEKDAPVPAQEKEKVTPLRQPLGLHQPLGLRQPRKSRMASTGLSQEDLNIPAFVRKGYAGQEQSEPPAAKPKAANAGNEEDFIFDEDESDREFEIPAFIRKQAD